MKHETRKKLIQALLSSAAFLALWGALVIAGSGLVDEKAVQAWLVKKEWLSIVSPHIRNYLIGYWRPLSALLLTASLFYPLLRNPAGYLARRLFLKGSPLTLSFGPTGIGSLESEFLYFYPPGFFHPCGLMLRNTGAQAAKIHRVELEAHIVRRVSDLGTEVLTGMGLSPLHFKNGERDEETGLQCKSAVDNCWIIDTPFTLAEEEVIRLPGLDLDYDAHDENAVKELQKLVGLATLCIQFNIRVLTDQGIISRQLSAPLRVLLSLEEGGDGGIGALLNKLDVKPVAERDRIRYAYDQARREDLEIRRAIAERLNEMEAAEKLDSADHAIELRPDDPTLHYHRGHILVELGRNQEALASLDEAFRLGLDNSDLHLARGAALRGLSRLQEALDEVDRVLTVHPNDPAAHAERGRVLIDLERNEDAVAAFTQSVRLDEGFAEAYVGRGLALIKLDNEEGALSDFDRATELDPDSCLAHVGRALALSGSGQDEKVLAALKRALLLGYSDLGILHSLETLMPEDARAKYRQLLDSYDLLRAYNSATSEDSGKTDIRTVGRQ